uniref:Receptor ligand binding region domain-containing protein n=1 Tax=Meloidogyne incognita TaxID=6306 RepID=A0A914NCM6_MELIC
MAPNVHSMKDTLQQIKNLVVAVFDSIEIRRTFLLAMTDTGISLNNEYVFIIPQLRNLGMLQQEKTGLNISKYNNFWMTTNGVNDGRDDDTLKAARRTIIVDLENQSNSEIDAFNAKVVAEFGKPPFNCVNECMGGPNDQIPAAYARSLHDTTYAYLRALNKTTEKFGYLTKDLARNGTLINNMSKGEFQGETGNVILDENGNREPIFVVTMLDISDQPLNVIQINFINNTMQITKNYNDETVIWANRGGKRPLYKPICGYTGTECPQNITIYILIGVGLVLLLLVATLGGIGYAVREKLKEKERLTRECLIPFGELKNIKELKSNEDMRSLEANKSLKSLQSSQSGSTKLTSMDDKKLETENYVHFLYNREVVFAIKYQVRVRIFNEDLFQLMKLRQLDHENLNKFCGLCTDAPILYAVWKHCQRGSLKVKIYRHFSW